MNKQEPISPQQMGVLFFTFMTGSSIINIPSPLIGKAGNGAWVSLLISGGVSMGLLGCMLYLHKRYPDMTFVEYSRKLIGTWPTAIMAVLPLSIMFQILTGIILDIGLFMRSSMMRETPTYAFTSLIFMVSVLSARAGIEVIARMFLLIMLLISAFITAVLVLAIENYDIAFLIPVMPDGIKPILKGAFFSYGFPYAECFVFTMLFPFVKKDSSGKLNRAIFLALFLNIATLCTSTICTIMLFGPLSGIKKYSLYELARTVDVQEIITRIESVIGMSLIAGSYMKATITLYAISLFVSQIFKLKDYKLIVTPIALVTFLNTLVGFDSDMDWVEIVSVVHPLWVWFGFILPLAIVMAAAMFRKPSG